ncbi:MAG: hypothetical protein R3B57_01390 [Phycisphaerales bacterium]
MLTVTDSARATLAGMLESNNAPEGVALRLAPSQQGGLGLTPDKPVEADTTFDHDGRTVLCVQEELVGQLEGVVIDAEQGANGPQLALRRAAG